MRIVSIGGGPAGLYFAILMKKARPGSQVTVFERNRADDTFGFGVVFSDATMENLRTADEESWAAVTAAFAHWDAIDVHVKGHVLTSTGHGFAGMSRQRLLSILQRRALSLGVELRFETEVPGVHAVGPADLILAADGVNSGVRAELAEHFGPRIDHRPNRFVWLGTTFPFWAFTFHFKENAHGLWRVHAYRYEAERSTFIVETTEAAWRAAGMDRASEDDTVAYCEELFAEELDGHRLLKNRSLWRSFPTVENRTWHHGSVVLVGDAAHTAHFSVGSGTKLALEDAIVLARHVLAGTSIPAALQAYEAERRPAVESLQRSAQVSLEWFESTERYMGLEPIQFAFSLLTRSLRVTHANLGERDPDFVRRVDAWYAGRAEQGAGEAIPPLPSGEPCPPMFTPFRLRGLRLPNRVVVSPMCMYSADDGTPGDWHLVHLGSRGIGGAGLVIAEMTDVTREGRITPGCAGMYKPEHVPAWRRITDFVHATSGAKIGIQLGHAGRKAGYAVPWEGDAPLPDEGWRLLAPSTIPWDASCRTPREMDRADLDETREAFVRAARMAREAGFDLVELHAAHGYLLSSFISPLSNRRTDAYGGSLENRMRFPLEVLRAVREAWPAEMPVAVRISAHDWAEGGTTPADAVAIARMLHDAGCDIVDVSSGGTVAHGRPRAARLYQTPFAERIRLEAGVPVMTVGAISSWEDVNSVLAAGRADLCVLARRHLYDPYFTHHAASEQGVPLPWPLPYAAMKGYRPRVR